MNRTTANKQAKNNKRTWRELRSLINKADLSLEPNLNAGMSRTEIAKILKDAIPLSNLDEVPSGAHDINGKSMHGTDFLIIRNILIEFG